MTTEHWDAGERLMAAVYYNPPSHRLSEPLVNWCVRTHGDKPHGHCFIGWLGCVFDDMATRKTDRWLTCPPLKRSRLWLHRDAWSALTPRAGK